MKKLYKLDSKGKTRVWFAQAIDTELHVSHGLLDGKLITDITECKAKNVGKTSATTPAEQAIKECAALYTRRVERKGYSASLSESLTGETSATRYPMLARDYSKLARQLNDVEFVWLSRKLDGVRAIWRPDVKKFQSRTGIFYSAPHLEELLTDTTENLDGELYIHGTPLNQIVSASRKHNELTEQLTFQVFDVVEDKAFRHRIETYWDATTRIADPRVVAVPQLLNPCTKDCIKESHDDYVKKGFEGVMIRRDDHTGYEEGIRSKTIYKYKEFLEAEFTIMYVTADKKGQAVLTCDCSTVEGFNPTGCFDVRCKGTDQYREYQLAHPKEFIGKSLTVRYFAVTEYGYPQFPIGTAIRDYE